MIKKLPATARTCVLTSLVAAVTAALAGGCGANDSNQSTNESITIAISTAAPAPKEEVATYSVAKHLGYYKQEGIHVKTIYADGSTAAVQAVASGSADITPADAGSTLAAVGKGVPVKAVGGLVQQWPWRVAVPPNSPIHNGADLKGTKIGVISLASGSAPYARAFIDAAGLKPGRDVKLVPVGVGSQAKGALDSGKVDALALYTQAYQVIENSGMKFRYLENPERFDGIRSLTWATTDDNLEQRKPELSDFLRASYKALLFSAANPRAAMRMGYEEIPQLSQGKGKKDKLADDVRSLKAWLATATPDKKGPQSWGKWGNVSKTSWQKTQDFAVYAGQLKKPLPLSKVWTDSLLKSANNFDRDKVLTAAKKHSE